MLIKCDWAVTLNITGNSGGNGTIYLDSGASFEFPLASALVSGVRDGRSLRFASRNSGFVHFKSLPGFVFANDDPATITPIAMYVETCYDGVLPVRTVAIPALDCPAPPVLPPPISSSTGEAGPSSSTGSGGPAPPACTAIVCENGGTCVDQGSSTQWECKCVRGFLGTKCDSTLGVAERGADSQRSGLIGGGLWVCVQVSKVLRLN